MVHLTIVDYDQAFQYPFTVLHSTFPMTASASSVNSRFSNIATAPPDAILGLTEAFNSDGNANKMNLSVGVYKDASGLTPVLRCVKEAERRLVEAEITKGYLPIDGLPDYRQHVRKLVFGDSIDASRIAVLQSPGGTGALRIAAGFLTSQLSPIRIWIPSPTWANHPSVFAAEGLPMESYRYLSADRTSFDFGGMLDDLKTKSSSGDAVLLHACCHNPTGVDPTPGQWREIARVIAEKRLLPVIDFAYQGFGDGLSEDTIGIREILNVCDEAIVCNSFSKNFGLYSERVGALFAGGGRCICSRRVAKSAQVDRAQQLQQPATPWCSSCCDHPGRRCFDQDVAPRADRNAKPHQTTPPRICRHDEVHRQGPRLFVSAITKRHVFVQWFEPDAGRSAQECSQHLHRGQRADQRGRNERRSHGPTLRSGGGSHRRLTAHDRSG